MGIWLPGAVKVVPDRYPHGAGAFQAGARPKAVVHTVETGTVDENSRPLYRPNTANYFGHQGWPHSTIDVEGIYQHISIDRAARTLVNKSGGVETNFAHAIQCEVMWSAKYAQKMPQALLDNLADWLTFIHEETGMPLVFAKFVAYPGSYGVNAAQRFTNDQWDNFTGVCGHQHVPENDHGDPGDLLIDRLFTGGTPKMTEEQAQLLKDVHNAMSEIKNGNFPIPALDVAVGKIIARINEIETRAAEVEAIVEGIRSAGLKLS